MGSAAVRSMHNAVQSQDKRDGGIKSGYRAKPLFCLLHSSHVKVWSTPWHTTEGLRFAPRDMSSVRGRSFHTTLHSAQSALIPSWMHRTTTPGFRRG